MSAGAGYTQAISDGLGTVSTVINAIGADKKGKAEEEAAQAAALIALEQAAVDAARSRRSAARQIGGQRGQVARSGISIQGSQGDLLLTNAFELELNAVYIERFGRQLADQETARAKSIAKARQLGRAANLIQSMKSGGAANYLGGASAPASSPSKYSPSNPAPYGDGQGVYTREFGGGGGQIGPTLGPGGFQGGF